MRRDHGPVVPVEIAPRVEAWLVIGHRELLHLTRDEQYISHDPRRWTPLREGRVAADSPLMPLVGWRPAQLRPEIEPMLREVASGEPEITFWRKLDTHDDVGWEG